MGSENLDERVTPIAQSADLAFTNPTSSEVIELVPAEESSDDSSSD